MEKREAKIECIVARPMFYGGKKFVEGDIFFYNPATKDKKQKTFYRNKRFYQLPEERYQYILVTKAPKKFSTNGKTYTYGEVVDVEKCIDNKNESIANNIAKRELFVKNGWLKKVILKDIVKADSKNKEDEKSKNIVDNKNEQITLEDCPNLSKLAKALGVGAKKIKEELDIKVGSYTKKLTQEQFDAIVNYYRGG